MITIIVPVYNVEKYLGTCIKSILLQTYRDFELILVNDGSKDKSGKICDEYALKDNRVRVFHKKNGGVSSARNYGIEHAIGQWICFIDSDDTIDSTYLEDFQLTDISYDLYMQGYKKRTRRTVLNVYSFNGYMYEELSDIVSYSELNYIINSPCFKLYKRSIIREKKIFFDTNTSYGEDHIFSLEYLSYVRTIKYTIASGYNYYVGERESLNNRIVPLNEMCYYTQKSRNLQMQFYNNYKYKRLLETYNQIYENNIIRVLRSLFAEKANLNKYNEIIDDLCICDNVNRLSLMSVRHAFVFYILLKFPRQLSYHILKNILKR